MAVLAESVHHRQDDRLAPNERQSFDEVKGDVHPDPLWHGQRKEEPGWVQVLRLVPLTNGARAHKILHKLLHVRKMKVAAQSVQRALDSFMSILMDSGHDLLNEGGRRGNVQAASELHHVVDDRPRCPAGARAHFVLDSDEGRVGELCLSETCDEVKARAR